MHVDMERLQRLVHGELDPAAEAAAQAHLAKCDFCRARLADLESDETELLGLLQSVDSPAPRVAPEQVIQRARRTAPQWYRWAAAIVLTVLAAGVAYALPGSPVASWLDAVTGRMGSDPGQIGIPLWSTGTAGVSIDAGQHLVVLLESMPVRGGVRIALVDGDEVGVRASSNEATFTFGLDSLIVEHPAATDTLSITIPHSAQSVVVYVADRAVFEKRASRIMTTAKPEPTGAWFLSAR